MVQNKYHSKSFHFIDKGNGAETKFDMGGTSKVLNWAPKLTMRFFTWRSTMQFLIYKALTGKHTPARRRLKMPAAIKELVNAGMQQGNAMKFPSSTEYPEHTRDLINVFDYGSGWGLCSDTRGTVTKGAARDQLNETLVRLWQS